MARTYQSMGYRDIQRYNRSLLQEYKELDKERKNEGLRNRGWRQVIELYEWLNSRVGKVATLLQSFFLMEQSASQIRETVSQANQSADQTLAEIEQSQDETRQQLEPGVLVRQYRSKNNIVEMGVHQ